MTTHHSPSYSLLSFACLALLSFHSRLSSVASLFPSPKTSASTSFFFLTPSLFVIVFVLFLYFQCFLSFHSDFFSIFLSPSTHLLSYFIFLFLPTITFLSSLCLFSLTFILSFHSTDFLFYFSLLAPIISDCFSHSKIYRLKLSLFVCCTVLFLLLSAKCFLS
ncbi:unnamed protein product [Acanthosepion pharaonis]|uniref:Uncharacterized protein n=1 Tax=Acanthosepion pharaonis TaxID=158019 RepID=A0A812E303_ACAPH|nr:unnamed protein product [Sepia pharaonis]